jgi:hypothetical protein
MATLTYDERLAQEISAQIQKLGGDHIATNIVKAARHTGLKISLGCAVLQHESLFKNVYGHDGVRNPIKSPPGGVKRVTRANYLIYRGYLKLGMGAQGVGYGQLTYPGFQQQADALGGCWKAGPNIIVSFTGLANNIRAHGEHDGVKAYNGNGPAAEKYAHDVLALSAHWHDLLA